MQRNILPRQQQLYKSVERSRSVPQVLETEVWEDGAREIHSCCVRGVFEEVVVEEFGEDGGR